MARKIPKRIMAEAEELHRVTLALIEKQVWAGHEKQVQAYNRLLGRVYQYNMCRDFRSISPVPNWERGTSRAPSHAEKAKLIEVAHKAQAINKALKDACHPPTMSEPVRNTEWAISRIQLICDRFDLMRAHLVREHQGRETCVVQDEYDVQRLIRSFLAMDFDDVREEECGPSSAGSSPRMDFLIMPYQIVLETKMTRKGLADKRIGEELIIDIARYKSHPSCRILFCFVFDPGRRIKNAIGLEKDIESKSDDSLIVTVAVRN